MSQASSGIPDDWVVVPAEENFVLIEPRAKGPTIMHVLDHGARGVGVLGRGAFKGLGHSARGVGVVGLEAFQGLGSGVSTELPHEEKIAWATNTLGVCTGATVRFIFVAGCNFVSGLVDGITAEPEEDKK